MAYENTLHPRRSLTQSLSGAILTMIGWRIEWDGELPPKCILVGAPHTTNWDFAYFLLFLGATGLRMKWVGKDSLFRWPLGGLFRKLGGISINRRVRSNFVQQVIERYNNSEQLVLAIAPEGTRSKADYWKTGFYYIALGAKIPIVLGYIDYPNKRLGIGPALIPNGDIQADFAQLSAFYAGKVGKYPQKQGQVQPRPSTDV